ncbi:hypothetical protein C464_07960 [Halorubrum coriense DSM 10284]|uniref:Uncharacterized protein n=1 Tax=Halorubrum coriense DSM 10284 TaxID=1227466 RepID=M0EJA3_9EURY|nr:hypothetical protein [Halorubrum coriense]ELZ47840.1 hypothetical protein C464_07960 [Halorubrum coriense DSM 10284]
MPPHSRRALLATAATGLAGGAAGCNAPLGGGPSSRPSARLDEVDPLYVADGVPLPDGSDPLTVEDPTGGRVALFPAVDADREEALAALRGATPVAFVGRSAQATLADVCAEDGRAYGIASESWGATTRVAAAVPYGDVLATHLFEGVTVPSELSDALDRVLNPPRPGCEVEPELPGYPDGFDDRGRTLGTAYVHGRNDVARFTRRDAVRVAPGPDRSRVALSMRGTIRGGGTVDGGDDRYAADQVRLVASFDERLHATVPPRGESNGLTVRREEDAADDAVDHRFAPTSDRTRRGFTACQRSLVTPVETPDPFSYVANARFRWRDPRLLRDDDYWHHHTPGRAVWYPDGGRSG